MKKSAQQLLELPFELSYVSPAARGPWRYTGFDGLTGCFILEHRDNNEKIFLDSDDNPIIGMLNALNLVEANRAGDSASSPVRGSGGDEESGLWRRLVNAVESVKLYRHDGDLCVEINGRSTPFVVDLISMETFVYLLESQKKTQSPS